ncbi:MAG TPA: phosphoenolpyruvate--protein phosphotransferase [Steroidobacteraceae bacterium]|nr:phosphoenolpyruvate--protein phosphotransferase [Steroidobacteraceae bacterium]
MKPTATLTLLAPLAGWSAPLDEVPDEVFAARLPGDGVAIDPTEGTLHAPCDAEVVLLPASRHAVTLRAAAGCEILLHVGIDTVGLGGERFEAHVSQGARVRAGEPLLSFDLDFLAQRVRSVLTPIIVTSESGWAIRGRTVDRAVALGERLMELALQDALPDDSSRGNAASAAAAARRLTVSFEHGIHARPAALLAASLRSLAADVRLIARGREANARSTVALMGLGVRHGEEVEIRASGPDAHNALNALTGIFNAHASASPAASPRRVPPVALAPAAAEIATTQLAESPAAHAAMTCGVLRGVAASPGLVVGRARQLQRPEVRVREAGAGAAAEHAALDRARSAVRARLERAALATPANDATGTAREIAAAHLELLDDPELIAAARAAIDAGRSAGAAWRAAVHDSADTLRALDDARLRERVDDLLDLETQVLLALAGEAVGPEAALPEQAIVIARELLPSQLISLDGARLAGIAMAAGGPTSHAAILAAAMGIPALVALGAQVLAVPDGTEVILDAAGGVLEVAPGEARLMAARARLAASAVQRAALASAAQRECRTADGVRIEVLANIGSVAEAQAAVRNGAEGCGLLRTEFLFLDRLTPPSEVEQTAQYQKIADALGKLPLTIRTLDAGGDKPIAYLPMPREENPALGLRGIRTSLAWPQLLRTQLRAVLGVRGPALCRVLLPMITDLEEIEAVRRVLEEVRDELGRSESIALGVMIETPAAALLAERLAAVADFLSIGTNDLTQYTLAMDRGNARLAARLDALHPAVLRLIARAAEGARAHARHAAVCGGLASEPIAAPLLVGLGVNELSVVPAVIPQLKARIGSVSLSDCRALAEEALKLPTAAAVRALAAALPAAVEVPA